jgi:hypothetical protein
VRFLTHYGDLTDSTNLIRIVQQTQPDEIYNLAAQSHVGLTASPRGVWARGRCGNWIIFLAGSGQWGPIAIQPKGDSKCHRCVCG